jgi:hypothetical protein
VIVTRLVVGLNDWEPITPLLSVTVMVKLTGPLAVGVPLIRPVVEFSDSPGGKAPLVTVKVNGPVPPLTETVCE